MRKTLQAPPLPWSPLERPYRLLTGEVRERLAELPDDSIQCVATSPPYFGLRDYGTGTWAGGDPDCDHVAGNDHLNVRLNELTGNAVGQNKQARQRDFCFRKTCGKCGAERADEQLGLEGSPDCGERGRMEPRAGLSDAEMTAALRIRRESRLAGVPVPAEDVRRYYEVSDGCGVCHVCSMVRVFREVRRVLRPDGTLWLNYGDSYATQVNGRSAAASKAAGTDDRTFRDKPFSTTGMGLKPKDMMGMPWRVAFALQADGWWLRSDVIWDKPNAMPSSVKDRPTSSHEYVFLFAKSERYFYDWFAIREPFATDEKRTERLVYGGKSVATSTFMPPNPKGKNKRTVWRIPAAAYPGAHFATFPEALVEPCLKAGSSEAGQCPSCGVPWRRVTAPTEEYAKLLGKDWSDREKDQAEGKGHFLRPDGSRSGQQAGKRSDAHVTAEYVTVGWEPGCKCPEHEPIPCVALDPFSGSGTTVAVALRLGRRAIGIDLKPEYQALAKKRIEKARKPFMQVPFAFLCDLPAAG